MSETTAIQNSNPETVHNVCLATSATSYRGNTLYYISDTSDKIQ